MTLESSGPVPFWEAIDRLSAAGRLAYRVGDFGDSTGVAFEGDGDSDGGVTGPACYAGPFRIGLIGVHEHREVVLVRGPWVRFYPVGSTAPADASDLVSAPKDGGPLYVELNLAAEPGLVCRRDGLLDDGPFRFHLVRLARHREVTPVRPPADPKSRESLSAEIQVVAEPGLAVSPIGPVILEEAVVDRGRDLRPDPPVGPAPNQVLPPRFEEGHPARFALQVPLEPGAGPGGRLRRLKGRVRVVVIARTGDPIIIPLAGAAGRPFSTAGTTLSVGVVRTVAETASFQFAIHEEQTDGRFSRGRAIEVGGYRPPDQVEYHVQLQDDRGRMLWWDASPLRSAEGGGLETSITIYQSPGGTPARLLYHGVIGAAAVLSFEFNDLPLP